MKKYIIIAVLFTLAINVNAQRRPITFDREVIIGDSITLNSETIGQWSDIPGTGDVSKSDSLTTFATPTQLGDTATSVRTTSSAYTDQEIISFSDTLTRVGSVANLTDSTLILFNSSNDSIKLQLDTAYFDSTHIKIKSASIGGIEDFGNELNNTGGLLDWGLYTVKTTNPIVQIHPRGLDEYIGDAIYNSYGVGMSVEVQNDTRFNKIKAKVIVTASVPIEARIYLNSSRQTAGVPQGSLIYSKNYAAGEFNNTTAVFTEFDFDNYIDVDAGQWLTVMVHTLINLNSRTLRFTTNPYSDRNGILFSSYSGDDPFNNSWSIGSASAYGETPLILEYYDSTVTNYYVDSLNSDKQIDYSMDLYLPDTIFAAIGREINIYYEALAFVNDYQDLLWESISTIGRNNNRSYRVNATGATADTTDVSISIYDESLTLLDTISTVIAIVDTLPVLTTDDAILCIGNSLTAGGQWVTELNDMLKLSGDTLNFVGTEGSAGYKHEGNSGKYAGWYLGSESPFYIGGIIDMQQYIADSTTASSLEYVIINLGINDVGVSCVLQSESIINSIVDNFQNLIDTIQSATDGYPDCKILLALTPIGTNNNTAFASNYGATRCRRIYETNLRTLHKALIAQFENTESIWLTPAFWNVDRYWGYTYVNEPECDRCVDNVEVHNNGVHPNNTGYYQMADVFFSYLKAIQ